MKLQWDICHTCNYLKTRGSASKMACSHDQQLVLAVGRRPLVLSTWTSPRTVWVSSEVEQETHKSIYDPTSKATPSCPLSSIYHTGQPGFSMWKHLMWGGLRGSYDYCGFPHMSHWIFHCSQEPRMSWEVHMLTEGSCHVAVQVVLSFKITLILTFSREMSFQHMVTMETILDLHVPDSLIMVCWFGNRKLIQEVEGHWKYHPHGYCWWVQVGHLTQTRSIQSFPRILNLRPK